MLSALSQSTLANSSNPNDNNHSGPTPGSKDQSPSKSAASGIKAEPDHDIHPLDMDNRAQAPRDHCVTIDPSRAVNDFEGHMDYADESPVHPFSMAPSHAEQTQMRSQPPPPPPPSQGSTHEDHNYNIGSNRAYPSTQPQQHQQLLKLKTEHGVATTPTVNTPDIIMTHDEDSLQDGSSSETEREQDSYSQQHASGRSHLVVDTSSSSPRVEANMAHTPSSPTAAHMDTPTTATSTTSSRRPSLRTMPATIPRSALQEETIALFKQFRNLIPCAKCFCRNTIQRDGMSDGNLRFKCRPPVSMSLICNKSYSESKIRNMIAGVVYGHSLPDSNTPGSSSGENSLALAPPPGVKSRRGSKVKAIHSPQIGSEKTLERAKGDQDDEDMDQSSQTQDDVDDSNPLAIDLDALEAAGDDRMMPHPQPSSSTRRPSLHGGKISRRASVQQLRQKSLAGEDAMMSSSVMDHDSRSGSSSQLPPMHQSAAGHHLQVPGTPPLDGEDSRSYRQQRPSYGPPARSVTPTGPSYPPQGPPSSAGRQKLHHSHSHPNIGQQRQQQYLEQQEYQREHRGSIGYSSHAMQQQQHRQLHRQLNRRESAQQLGAPTDRRSSQSYASSLQASSSSSMTMSSPIPSSQKLLGHGHEAHSPAMSASPRSSPSREIVHQAPHGHNMGAGTPPLRTLTGAGRFDEGGPAGSTGYFQRRMSQPHAGYGGYASSSSSSGLPPPMPSPLSHPYDRRASEAEEYPQMHRDKYERLNASTLLAPGSASSRPPHQKLRAIQPAPPSSSSSPLLSHPHSHSQGQNNGSQSRQSFRGDISPQHPLDPVDHFEESSRQPLTPPTRYSQPSHHHQQGGAGGGSAVSSQVSSPWISHGGHPGLGTPQSEPMRYSHSLPSQQARSGVRHQGSSSSLYYQTPRMDERDQYDSEQGGDSNREMSPEYQEMDSDGRPIIRTNHGAKRKSIGHALNRVSSHHNLYMTHNQHQQQQQQQQQHHQSGPQRIYRASTPMMDSTSSLDKALPKSAIKLTCFPPGGDSNNGGRPTNQTLELMDAVSLQLQQSSKLVIEITQPAYMQSYPTAAADNSQGNSKSVHRAKSQPNLKRTPLHQAAGSSTSPHFSIRRSASPYDSMEIEGGSASKKRRSDDSDATAAAGLDRRHSDEGEMPIKGDMAGTMAEATAAALAAAAKAVVSTTSTPLLGPSNPDQSSSAVQVFGVDYLNKKDIGLGLSSGNSPTIEALKVAQASSYVTLEDQKELGVDYSLFTRVETAGWRILIPPNVVASFRSEDFGLMLRPKVLELDTGVETVVGDQQQQLQDKGMDAPLLKQEREDERRSVRHDDCGEEMVDELEDDEVEGQAGNSSAMTFGAHRHPHRPQQHSRNHSLVLRNGHTNGARMGACAPLSTTTTLECSSSMNSLSSMTATLANDEEEEEDDDDDDDDDLKDDKDEDNDDTESDRRLVDSIGGQGLRRADEDEDVNAVGVSRIALGDRDDHVGVQHKTAAATMYRPFQQQQEDVEMEMETEQDELVEERDD